MHHVKVACVVRHGRGSVARARGEQLRQHGGLRPGDERHRDDRHNQQQEQHEAVHLGAIGFLRPAFGLQLGDQLDRLETVHLGAAADIHGRLAPRASRLQHI